MFQKQEGKHLSWVNGCKVLEKEGTDKKKVTNNKYHLIVYGLLHLKLFSVLFYNITK